MDQKQKHIEEEDVVNETREEDHMIPGQNVNQSSGLKKEDKEFYIEESAVKRLEKKILKQTRLESPYLSELENGTEPNLNVKKLDSTVEQNLPRSSKHDILSEMSSESQVILQL